MTANRNAVLCCLQTPSRHEDMTLIEQAITMIEDIVSEVDRRTGEAKCTFTRQKLDFIDEKQVGTHLILTAWENKLHF